MKNFLIIFSFWVFFSGLSFAGNDVARPVDVVVVYKEVILSIVKSVESLRAQDDKSLVLPSAVQAELLAFWARLSIDKPKVYSWRVDDYNLESGKMLLVVDFADPGAGNVLEFNIFIQKRDGGLRVIDKPAVLE